MHTSHNKHRSGAQITDSELDVSCDTRGGGGGRLYTFVVEEAIWKTWSWMGK